MELRKPIFKWQAIDKTNRDVPRLRDKGRLKGAEEGGEGGGDCQYKNEEVLPEKVTLSLPVLVFCHDLLLKACHKGENSNREADKGFCTVRDMKIFSALESLQIIETASKALVQHITLTKTLIHILLSA